MISAPHWFPGYLSWQASLRWPWRELFRDRFSMGSSFDEADRRANQQTRRATMDHFEAFVHQYERQILNYLWRMTADEQTAFDLCQETFLRAWRHFATIKEYDRPRAWLFRVATNLAFSHKRTLPHTPSATSLLEEDETDATDPIHHFVESDLVRQILRMLPPRRQAALIVSEVYGFSADEAAAVFGMTPGAFKMTLSRGREQFRQCYLRETQQ